MCQLLLVKTLYVADSALCTSREGCVEGVRRCLGGPRSVSDARWSKRLSLMFFREHELLDGPAFDEMFLNDALEHCGSHRVIPRALWINHRNRSLVTDAKAIRLRTINGVFRSRESQLFQSLF